VVFRWSKAAAGMEALFELFCGLAKTASESECRQPDPQGAAQNKI
jgi:hypothetical protein